MKFYTTESKFKTYKENLSDDLSTVYFYAEEE